MPGPVRHTDVEAMTRTFLAPHPDERLLDAVSGFGRWLEEEDRTPAPERLALVLDGPVWREVLAQLAPIDRQAA
jgi:hypothetical protein